MSIDEGGAALYFCLSFGSGYAIGNLKRMGFLNAWMLSVFFVPLAYELLHANWLMLQTVIGFSLGLFVAQLHRFYDLIDYLKTMRHAYRSRRKALNLSHHPHPTHDNTIQSMPFDVRSAEEILGLPAIYSFDELKTAFQRESQRTHPDKWLHKPVHIRQMMENEQKRINWAYQHLTQMQSKSKNK